MLDGISSRDVTYRLRSAEHLSHIPTESIHYVFTDPPFGSNIFYSDMNLFQEAWLGRVTDYTSEAVVHTTGKRETAQRNDTRVYFVIRLRKLTES